MQDILKDLYYGQISPGTRSVTDTEERRAMSKQVDEEEDYFTYHMSVEDRRRFRQLTDLCGVLGNHDPIDTFSCSLKLGARLTLAIIEV